MKTKLSVLIADDNEALAEELFEHINIQPDMRAIATANNGEEAWSLILETNPDIVILDMVMPKLDGMGVLKRIRELSNKPIVIAYSVSALQRTVETAVSLGADYYLLKPQSCERVVDTIRELTKLNTVTVDNGRKIIDLETLVTECIHELGVPAHIKAINISEQQL